jgi:quercetin dioxygenase-like cupin family protein
MRAESSRGRVVDSLAVQAWKLRDLTTEAGTSDPVVLLTEEEARAVFVDLHPGQELGDHQVKEHAWVVVVDGVAEIGAGDERLEAPAGTLAHFEPDERHYVRSAGGAKILMLLAPWPGPGHYRGHTRGESA